jgi:hypothetical protein
VSLWPACPVTVSQRRVAIEVAGLAVWAEALPETKLTDEQVPFYLYLCHVLLRFTLVLICNTKISEKSDMAKS